MTQTFAELETIKTPSLVLDVGRVRRNAARMSERIEKLGARLRPHVKTHKCVEVARIQTAPDARRITVSTLAEARHFARHGFADITYAVPIEQGKFAEAIELSHECEHFALITDDAETARDLDLAAGAMGATLAVYLKTDCGYHRCGVEPGTPASIELARLLADSRHLRFAGILTHAGHSYYARSRDEMLSIARQEREVMVAFAARLRAEGVSVLVVSIGSTPTMTQIDDLGGVDEARPGNYIFFDAYQATLGSCTFQDCALTVLAAVTHRDRARRRVTLDAGAVALSKDAGARFLDSASGFGRVLDLAGEDLGVRLDSLSQEHGSMLVEDDQTFDHLKVGARVRVLANHSCLAAAQHAYYNVLEGDRIVDRWEIHRGW